MKGDNSEKSKASYNNHHVQCGKTSQHAVQWRQHSTTQHSVTTLSSLYNPMLSNHTIITVQPNAQ